MHIFSDVLSWLLVLALIGMIAAFVWIAVGILKIKNEAMRTAKRLGGPVSSGKNLYAAGRGVYDQEEARVRRVAARVTATAGTVRETADHIKTATETFRQIDFEGAARESKALLKLATVIIEIFKAAKKQGPE